MSNGFDSMIRFKVTRAKSYPHAGPGGTDFDSPIQDLDVRHLIVDTSVEVLGTVTLAASSRNAAVDPYGHEFDLTPGEARRIGAQLLAAAAEAERQVEESRVIEGYNALTETRRTKG